MKKSVCSLFALAVVAVAVPALAHQGHDHHDKPAEPEHKTGEHPQPHGGQVFVLDATDHLHAEVVFGETGLHLWLYDADMKPLTPPADAKVTLVVGKEVRKLDLKLMEKFGDKPDAHLGVDTALPKDGKVAAVLQLTFNGKLRSGRVERTQPVSATAPTTPTPAPPTMPTTTTPTTTTTTKTPATTH